MRGIYKFISIVLSYCEMKKLVLFAAVAVAMSLSACKKAAPQEPVIPEEEVITVVDEAAVDSDVVEIGDAAPAEVAE